MKTTMPTTTVKAPLAFYIQEPEALRQTIERLRVCSRPKEWVTKVVYPLYLDELLTYEEIHTRRFIEATLPYCLSLRRPTVGNLHCALYRFFNLPR